MICFILAAVAVLAAVLLIYRHSAGPAEILEEIAPAASAPLQAEPVSEPVLSSEPEIIENGIRPADRDIDFADLLKINEDVIAWISVPGADIDYPVVWRESNVYYLDRGLSGKYSMYGTIFMDMGNSPDFTDPNSVIYGHNMPDGSMFAGLHDFASLEFFEKNREIKLYTEEGMRIFEIFAAYETDDNSILYENDFLDDAVWQAYTQDIFESRKKGTYLDPGQIGPNDRILTLSTCVKDEDEKRYLVQGLLKK